MGGGVGGGVGVGSGVGLGAATVGVAAAGVAAAVGVGGVAVGEGVAGGFVIAHARLLGEATVGALRGVNAGCSTAVSGRDSGGGGGESPQLPRSSRPTPAMAQDQRKRMCQRRIVPTKLSATRPIVSR